MVQALPSNIGIQQVTLKVADLDKMVNFYTKTIGLKLLKQGEGRAWLAPQGTNDAILVLKELTAGEENQGPLACTILLSCYQPKRFRQYVAVAFAGKCANWRSRSAIVKPFT